MLEEGQQYSRKSDPIAVADCVHGYLVRPLSVLDAFAGAGGFSLGFELAGCRVVGAIEIDEWASQTFAANHRQAIVMRRDISTVADEELAGTFGITKPDIIIGGPPCQGFSICVRENRDPKDPRNSLFQDFIRLGRVFEPKALVMENVPNIARARTHDGTLVVDIIRRELEHLGYHVYMDVLQAVQFGVPQIRKRFFVVASTKKLDSPFPKASHRWTDEPIERSLFDDELMPCPTLWDAISDLPQIEAGQGQEEARHMLPPQTSYQEMLRGDAMSLYNHVAMRHGKRMVERFKSMSWGDSISDVPHHLKPRKRNSEEIAEYVYDQNNRRMYPNRPCHTLPASFYANFVHPYCHRNFTAREGARIQGFPDNFIFKGKPTLVSQKLLTREGRVDDLHLCQYNQIGNAVPPLLAQAVASNLLRQLSA